MISEDLDAVKQREDETTKDAQARFDLGILKSLRKFKLFTTSPLDFTPRVRREWKQKKVSP